MQRTGHSIRFGYPIKQHVKNYWLFQSKRPYKIVHEHMKQDK